MKTEYELLTAPYMDELMKNLKGFVAINSERDESTMDKDNPCGKGVSKALKFFEELAKKDGFEVTNYSNKIVEANIGKGDKNITIMAHADVVPAGSGWDQNPFEVVEKNGVLTGRGVADDKGPLLACYYGLKALKDNNMLGNYQVRFLVGGAEETTSEGMMHYFYELNKPQPTLGFSPDSSWPLIFAEKGIFNFKVRDTFKIDKVYSIKGGVASNAVIERCKIEMDEDAEFEDYVNSQFKGEVEFSNNNGRRVVTFIGQAAHGSIPWVGKNAAMMAVYALGCFYKNEKLMSFFSKFMMTRGEGLNVNMHNDEMFDNSLNLGIFKYENEELFAIFNFRFINSTTFEECKSIIEENAKPFNVEFGGCSPLLYFPKDSVLVSTLLKAYIDETGEKDAQPLSTGGGTYAKEAQNVVAFGMEEAGWDSKMHSAGEQVKVSSLEKAMAIYARAIVELGKKL
ncbi:MAG: Sapep family Mn(2+)-dependent dipeptidase [Bacilli bacterium]|nr:Sapep family Mn(2+)-dependent dipeptidase [Bacilli bacterium]